MDLKDKLLKGAKSLGTIALNAATGVDQIAPDNEILKRKAICASCPELKKPLKQCSVCLCFTDFKTTIAAEKCPLDKWLPVEPKKS